VQARDACGKCIGLSPILMPEERTWGSFSERYPFHAEFQGRTKDPTFCRIIAVCAGDPYPSVSKFFK
jgi:hypothetical protein